MSIFVRRIPVPALLALGIAGFWGYLRLSHGLQSFIAQRRFRKALKEKFGNTKEDVVVLHCLPRGKTAPSNSPFVLKLETFLRMAEIPYELDIEFPFGINGKTPWVTLNGNHISDSHLIMEFLIEKYNKANLQDKFSPKQRGMARAVRVMLDEYLYWGLGLWRYVYSDWTNLGPIFDFPDKVLRQKYYEANKRVKTNAWSQGIGRMSQQQVIHLMEDNLRALSNIIGTNNFLLGNEPCVEDCSVFAWIVQLMHCAPGSPYEKLIRDELHNLQNYATRMRLLYWPDWKECKTT